MVRKVMRRVALAFSLACLCVAALASSGLAAGAEPVVPVKGVVTLVDFGADYCPPCRLMVPVLQNAKKDYHGRAAVVVVDVTEHARLATRLGVRVIPTQIFYDRKGQEVARHEGYLDRRELGGQLDRMLAR